MKAYTAILLSGTIFLFVGLVMFHTDSANKWNVLAPHFIVTGLGILFTTMLVKVHTSK